MTGTIADLERSSEPLIAEVLAAYIEGRIDQRLEELKREMYETIPSRRSLEEANERQQRCLTAIMEEAGRAMPLEALAEYVASLKAKADRWDTLAIQLGVKE